MISHTFTFWLWGTVKRTPNAWSLGLGGSEVTLKDRHTTGSRDRNSISWKSGDHDSCFVIREIRDKGLELRHSRLCVSYLYVSNRTYFCYPGPNPHTS